ncbi:hypothetical protein D3C75_666070 [compost metagenome]
MQPVNLVNEQHIALLQIGQQRGQIAGPLNGRTGCCPQVHTQLIGDNIRESRFPQPWRPIQQHMVQRFTAHFGCFYINFQILFNLVLSDIFPQIAGTQT